MNKLWYLFRIQALGFFGINKMLYSRDKKEKSKFIRMAVMIAFVAISILASLLVYEFMFMDSFSKAGMPELMPAIMMAAAAVVTMFTTVYKVNGLIIGFKDFDIIMSMPIKTNIIVVSRLLLLYIMNFGFCLVINLTAGIVYVFFVHTVPALYFPFLILSTLFVPLVPMIAGLVAGILITAFSSRFRYANIINIIGALILTLAFMAASFGTSAVYINPDQVADALSSSIYRIYPLARMYTKAVYSGDIASMIFFVLISAITFAAFSVLLGIFFKKLNTMFMTRRTRSNYKITSLNVSSVLYSLYKRELRRYFSSVLYVLNTGFGMILALLMCLSLIFFRPAQLELMLEIPGFAEAAGTLMPMVLTVMVTLSCTTCSSVSLEGNNLWIIKSLPVKPETVFASKILVNLTVTVPATFVCGLVLAFVLPLNPVQIILMFLTPTVFAVLSAEVGLFFNLLYPNFDWKTETVVIKQSLPVMISTLGGMTVSIALLVGLISLPDNFKNLGMISITAVVAILDIVIYKLLKTKGPRLFAAL
jgi:ABC-2 type transport system permease protein